MSGKVEIHTKDKCTTVVVDGVDVSQWVTYLSLSISATTGRPDLRISLSLDSVDIDIDKATIDMGTH